LRKQRIALGRAVATQGGDLRDPTLDGTKLLAKPTKLALLPNVVIVDRAEEVRKRVLQSLGEPVVVRPVEEMLLAGNLVLLLEAQRQRMANGCRERRPPLSNRRLMSVVANANPRRQGRRSPLQVGRLPQFFRVRHRDGASRRDEILFASLGPQRRAAACDECLPRRELESEPVPSDAKAKRPVGHVAVAAAEAVVDDVAQRRFARLRCARDDVDLAGLKGSKSISLRSGRRLAEQCANESSSSPPHRA